MTSDERDELHDKYTNGYMVEGPATEPDGKPTQVRKIFTSTELLDKIVEGWGGMLDESGALVPYSHEERRAMERVYHGLEQAMAVSWYDHFFLHQRAAAEKNSEAQSGTTSAETTRAAT